MPTLESLGLGSGVLTTDLVDKLIKAERESVDLRLETREKLTEARITAYGEVKSRLSELQATAISLSSPTLTGATKVTSSDESILTATGSISAVPGTYNVEVLNTAKSHSLATGAYDSVDSILGTGTLVFSFGALLYDNDGKVIGQDYNSNKPGATIKIDESNRSLAGVRDAINKADMGVTASIVNDGTGYRLQLVSTETGEENAMRIQVRDQDGNMDISDSGLGALAFNENHANMQQTSKGQDAQLLVNGLSIKRASNTIDEVVRGVTLNLKSADVGKNISISVEPDVETLTKTLQSFVDGYNSLKEFVDANSEYDTKTKSGGLFMGDSSIQNMMSQLRAMISQPIVGISGSYKSLTELGINTNWTNKYLLDFNTSTLAKALTDSRNSVVGLLSKTGTTTDSQITYMNDSVNTKPGTYDVTITQLATQAKLVGSTVAALDFANPVRIDGTNSSFSINLNGKTAQITLEEGFYNSGDELAKQIAMQINSNETFREAGSTVSVDFNAAKKNFEITSNLYGSGSQLSITGFSPNVANTLGFSATGKGEHSGVGLKNLNAEAFAGKSTSTLPGGNTVDADTAINFAANNATFDLTVNGVTANIVVNQNAQGSDLTGDGKYDRNDTLQAIQNALDASSLSGQVLANFDKEGHLIFKTTAVGASQSIEITNVGNSASDVLLGLKGDQGAITNGKDAGLVLSSPTEFKVQVNGTESDTLVSVPAGTYATGDDLAQAIQTALQHTLDTDPKFAGKVSGASTNQGSRDLSTVDFAANPAGLRLTVNGTMKEIIVNGTDPDPLVNIQSALNAEFSGDDRVLASLTDGKLTLTTEKTGREQSIEVAADGRGAYTSGFAGINNGGIDFSANNVAFDLEVDGVTISVNVNQDATQGSNDANSNLAAIQNALNTAMRNTGEFGENDIIARLDDSGNLYFETLRRDGKSTAGVFGSSASIEVKNVSSDASTLLGMSAETGRGYDGFGIQRNQLNYGSDLDASVKYQYNPDTGLGSFSFNIGGLNNEVRFTELDNNAISILGLQDKANYQPEVSKGKDVAGTINGVEGRGEGQFLRAADDTSPATNGFYLGREAADFSGGVTIDSTNNRFKIEIDGVEAEITLAHGSYNSGSAMASALQAAINENAAFKSKSISVKVDYGSDEGSFAFGKFGIISGSTGSKSSVKITEANSAASDLFGFVNGRGDGEVGKEKLGEDNPASGLRLKVTGGALGDRGSVTFVSGFGDQLKNIMNGFLNGKTSLISTRQDAFDRDLANIDKERTRLNERMDSMSARLRSSFQYNDAIIARLNTTLSFVEQQFEAMASMGRKK